ncbi:hypothetical protein BDQ17DRAFT_1352666 [Cyathus striatus]|nr:hypothetical protein BDQ17DRAFT_1352666 [Cyathus striatus]
MYDEHGRLPSKAFSNSPPPTPKEGRAQCKRSGSTLRQLLGAPDSLSSRDGNEGDISWAERFLGENESATSLSSASLPTPKTPDAPSFDSSLPRPSFPQDITISTDNDNSGTFDNPAISSMDVELSLTSESSGLIIHTIKEEEPIKAINPVTPRRASQVFGFLTERRRSKNLPDPPSVFSSPSEDGCSQHDLRSHFSDTSSECRASPSNNNNSAMPYSSDTHRGPHRISTSSISRPMPLSKRSSHASLNSNSQHVPRSRRESIVCDIAFDQAEDEDNEDPDIQTAQKVRVIMSGPTKVIVTAPTPSQTHITPSRIPHGPRAPRRRSASGGYRSRPVMLTERSNTTVSRPSTQETHIPTPSSKRKTSALHKTSSALCENGHPLQGLERRKESISSKTGLENKAGLGLSVKTEIPLTPLRTNSSTCARSPLYRTTVNRDMFKPPPGMTPSPASTSEMSPVGRQLMMDIRQQRMAAREVDREKTAMKYTQRSGSTRSTLQV